MPRTPIVLTHTVTMRASMTAYSTAVGPSSCSTKFFRNVGRTRMIIPFLRGRAGSAAQKRDRPRRPFEGEGAQALPVLSHEECRSGRDECEFAERRFTQA